MCIIHVDVGYPARPELRDAVIDSKCWRLLSHTFASCYLQPMRNLIKALLDGVYANALELCNTVKEAVLYV